MPTPIPAERPVCLDVLPVRSRLISPRLMAVVHERDNFTCGFCGFRCTRYQQVLVRGPNWRDLDQVVTACMNCQQCFCLDLIAEQKSGMLIHFPAATQEEINRVLPELFLATSTQGVYFERAMAGLKKLAAGREQAAEALGSHEAGKLATKLRACRTDDEQAELRSKLKDIRLLAANRRVTHEGTVTFNQFPMILAYWKSAFGPWRSSGPEPLPCLERFLARHVPSG